jgi:regulator of sirC expression with transglutaminase-like and TPR domain
MKDTKEIKALFHLLDDPDADIFKTVSTELIHYGKNIIPNLENLWETTEDERVQERIISIIHKLNFQDVVDGFTLWFAAEKPSLLDGAILISKFRSPEVDEDTIRKTIKSIYQSCWLELNNYLTPLEQVTIINSIFYSMYKFKGFNQEESKINFYYLHEVIDTRHGNNFSLAILYQTLCEMLDIPVFAIQLPQQYMLAYFDTQHDFYRKNEPVPTIQFYIDPVTGNIYTQNDVDVYLNKYKLVADANTYTPLSNQDIIASNLEALMHKYKQMGEFELEAEILQLIALRTN